MYRAYFQIRLEAKASVLCFVDGDIPFHVVSAVHSASFTSLCLHFPHHSFGQGVDVRQRHRAVSLSVCLRARSCVIKLNKRNYIFPMLGRRLPLLDEDKSKH